MSTLSLITRSESPDVRVHFEPDDEDEEEVEELLLQTGGTPTVWQPSQDQQPMQDPSQDQSQEQPMQDPSQNQPTQNQPTQNQQATQLSKETIRVMVYNSYSRKMIEDLADQYQVPALFTLCIGLKHGNLYIANVDAEPYKSAKGKRNFTPKL
jgi:FtsZ-interacting cell division protein ZipA